MRLTADLLFFFSMATRDAGRQAFPICLGAESDNDHGAVLMLESSTENKKLQQPVFVKEGWRKSAAMCR